MNEYFVSADIGGTKVLLQAAEAIDGCMQVRYERRYPSRDYPDFSDMLRDFLDGVAMAGVAGNPASACFAVAGPITQQRANLTNLPWVMDSAVIEKEFSIPAVKLINDFKAVALSIQILSPSDLVTLQAGGTYDNEMGVVLGAGTGMGVAWLIWQGDRYIPLPSEAGHVDFAPTDELQDHLLQYLRKKFGHVSVERLLSGPGLTNIFEFLEFHHRNDAPELAQASLGDTDAARVADLAFNHKHPLAVRAMDLFVEIYGAYAGNLALSTLSRGGVYVAGGIAPKIIDKLEEGGFMKAFCDKGRFSALMSEIPVHVVMNPRAGLLGAAYEAQRMLLKND
ncbi:glucokinase [Nitrosospira sp. Nsp13]|jgi:glucokinase|uniref:glucokinase n=1 Tax=Nitrosospira sp. Nsp13 TaxID=1855332 RepID=UPI00088B4DB1|nr:glucokinase [Nitrosospira sp. Nsp13]SCY33836.1 glucokinase [Nitrosospira sp. Nsp13]